MTESVSELRHASCVAIGGRAVLIEGGSGSGKSDLALRLIDRGAALVADDYTFCRREGEALLAAAHANIRGKIEVRGLGILELPYIADAPVAMLVVINDSPPRLPERFFLRRIAGIEIAEIALPSLEPSAPIKVELALRRVAA